MRQLLGLGALVVLIALAAATGSMSSVRGAAVVAADQTFRITSAEPGQYAWTLESGRPPGGSGLVRQRALQVDRAELIDLTLPPALTTGQAVAKDQVIAELGSGKSGRRLAELTAARDELAAKRALLVAGGRPEAIAAAESAVSVALAAHAQDAEALKRLRSLSDSGAVSAEELHQAELRDTSSAREVELARARVAEARVPARPEEIAALDARKAAIDAQLTEIETLAEDQHIKTPIAGILQVGGGATFASPLTMSRQIPSAALVEVFDLDPVYVRVALPEGQRGRVASGAPIVFTSPAFPDREFEGRIAEIAETVVAGPSGHPMFFLTAEIANPDLALRSGMSGTLEVNEDGWNGRFAKATRGTLGQ